MNFKDLQPGIYVRKKNYTVFYKHKHGEGKREEDNNNAEPFLLIECCQKLHDNLVRINQEYQVPLSSLVILTDDESIEYRKKWTECLMSEALDSADLTSCIREDNGNPKVKQPEWPRLKRILFEKRMTRPNDRFEAYKCPICGANHLGKRKLNS